VICVARTFSGVQVNRGPDANTNESEIILRRFQLVFFLLYWKRVVFKGYYGTNKAIIQ
jgi:hypothetical protein